MTEKQLQSALSLSSCKKLSEPPSDLQSTLASLQLAKCVGLKFIQLDWDQTLRRQIFSLPGMEKCLNFKKKWQDLHFRKKFKVCPLLGNNCQNFHLRGLKFSPTRINMQYAFVLLFFWGWRANSICLVEKTF